MPVIEQVDVDDARGISFSRRGSAKGIFNALDFPEKIVRLEFGRKFKHRIEEGRRIWGTVDGRSFVNFGTKHGLGPVMESEELAPSGLKVEEARFDVRPKCNPGTHGSLK